MKLFSKIATAFVGIAMAVGVGVAVNAGNNVNSVAAETTLAATFSCGDDGAASHADGSSATTYSETSGDYTLSITDGTKFYTGARDAKGNGCFKFGTGSAIGSINFTVPSDVLLVKIYVAGYKTNNASVSINSGTAQTITTLSNNGSYTAVDVDTSSSKSVSFKTTSSGYRCMVNTIEFYVDGGDPEKQDTSVEITTSKPLNLSVNDDPVQLAVTTTPSDLPLTYVSSDESVVSVSNSGLITPQGTGSSTITVSFAGDDDYNASSDTISVTVTSPEPAHVTGKTISEIVSETTSADPLLIYEVEGYVTSWYGSNTDGTQYGNFYIADTAGDTSNQACVYGANYANGAVWNGMKYTFSNNKTFLTNEVTSQITIGTKVTAEFIAFIYNGATFEFQGEIKTVYNPTKELSSITLDTSAVKTSFEVNDVFTYEGLVVTANYSDETSKVVTPTSVSSPDMTSIGEKTVTVSYTENEVTKEAEYNIEVTAPVQKWTVSFLPGEGSGTMPSVQVNDGSSYTLPTCTFTAPEGKAFDYWEVDGEKVTVLESVTSDVEATAIWKEVTEVTDILNNGNTINEVTTSYSSWTTEPLTSGVVYAGQSAGDKTTIQLRSNNSNSGVVSTTSAGDLVSVKLQFHTDTAATRTVSVYGSTNAYTDPTNLYNDSLKGTLLGEANIDDGATQTITVEGSYQYVGIRSKSGALYLESIEITWNTSVTPPEPKVLTGISVSGAKTDFTVGEDFVTTGLVVTAHYDDTTESVVTTGYDVDSTAVNKNVAGTYNVVVTYEGFQDDYDVTYTAPTYATYKKVKHNLADFSGDYLIVFEGDSDHDAVAFDGSLEALDVTSNGVAVTIENEQIVLEDKYEFTFALKTDGYSIRASSGKYIGRSATSNGLNISDNDDYTNAPYYSDGEGGVISEKGLNLRYNTSTGQLRFRFFTTTSSPAVALYQKVADDGETLMLDLLNKTDTVCTVSEEHQKSDFESAWSELKTAYNAITDVSAKARLSSTAGDADGTMFFEGLARYDILVRKYGLENFISDRDVQGLGTVTSISNNTVNTNFALVSVIIVAVVSVSAIGVLLVVKKRKYHI